MIALIIIPLLIAIFVIGYLVVSRFDKFMNDNGKNRRKARKRNDSDSADKNK